MSSLLGNYVTPVPAQQRVGKNWYLGSADAIFQSLNLVHDEKPDYVVVVGADHVYRMDFADMVDAHIASGAKASVAAIRQPISLADQFGVIDVDPQNPARIRAFLEKPTDPQGLPDSPDEVLASMGNYVFSTDALIEAVTRDADLEDSKHDMGGDIIPAFVERGEAFVYDFKDNEIPGAEDRDRGYWRDVGTIDSYFDAQMDLVSIHPIFNLYNDRWPIHTTSGMSLPPAKFVHGSHGRTGTAVDSIVSPGCIISGATVSHSVLSPNVVVRSFSDIDSSILLDGVKVGRSCIVRRAIIDKDVTLPEGTHVGIDHDADRARGFTVTDSGIVVVGKGTVVTP